MCSQAENLLLSSDGMIKLCDFGSATNQQVHPDSSWTSVQRGLAEDEVINVHLNLRIKRSNLILAYTYCRCVFKY